MSRLWMPHPLLIQSSLSFFFHLRLFEVMSSFKPGFVLLVLTQVSDLNFEHGNIKFYLTVSHLNSLAEDLFKSLEEPFELCMGNFSHLLYFFSSGYSLECW